MTRALIITLAAGIAWTVFIINLIGIKYWLIVLVSIKLLELAVFLLWWPIIRRFMKEV